METGAATNRFFGLHRKGIISLSLLLLALGASFGTLNYRHLTKQFEAQQAANGSILQAEFRGLMERSASRLQRLGLVLASLGKFDQLLGSGQAVRNSVAVQQFFTSAHYELDVERIALFDVQRRPVWQWAPAGVSGIPEPRLQEALRRVGDTEQPAALLTCQPTCSLHVFVPLLSEGRNVGILSLSQMITDLVLDFSTGAGTDIAVLVPTAEGGGSSLAPWPVRVAALSNASNLDAFLRHLSSRYSGPDKIDANERLIWNGRTYTVRAIPLERIMDGEAGQFLLIGDVGAATTALRQASRDALLLIAIAVAVAEVLLIVLLRNPLRRIQYLASTLPKLAHGGYREMRERLDMPGGSRKWADEIDILYATSIQLAQKVEKHQHALMAERDFIQGLLDNAQVLIFTQTRGGTIHAVNELMAQLVGRTSAEMGDVRFLDLIEPGDEDADIAQRLDELFSHVQHRLEHEAILLCHDGSRRHVVWVHTRLTQEHPSGIAVLSIGLDATDRVLAESHVRWLANHDPLTGLTNRFRFNEELERSIAEAQRNGMAAALLLFDLDHFKDVNDSSGHAAGDALLRLLADELRSRTRKSDISARLGGDEFAVLMPLANRMGAEQFARDLNQRLTDKPFVFGNRSYRISASIGIALIPDHGASVEELMANADAAMYQAKNGGRGRFHVFSPAEEARTRVSQRAYWRNVIAQSLAERRLFFHYQPIFHIATGRLAYHEALLRLEMDDGRIVPPGEFMDVILHSDLMTAIDGFVVGEAARVLRDDEQSKLSINLSSAALADPVWATPLIRAVQDGVLTPDRLLLEITETAAIADLGAAKRVMEALSEAGFRFAMDDFGAGFASFYYLRHLPIEHVKIDRSFVSRLAIDEGDKAFVTALTTLAHGYGQKVVAEGVENAETLSLLRDLGVDFVQGFFVGRPGQDRVYAAMPMTPRNAQEEIFE